MFIEWVKHVENVDDHENVDNHENVEEQLKFMLMLVFLGLNNFKIVQSLLCQEHLS